RAIDCIVKPITTDRLVAAVGRAREARRRITEQKDAARTQASPMSPLRALRPARDAFDSAIDSLFVDLEPIVDLASRKTVGFDARLGSRIETLQTHTSLVE